MTARISLIPKKCARSLTAHTEIGLLTVWRPGTQLGSLEIAELLGVGGMGDVYRARDTKLKRDVAIKILPDKLSRDPDRLSSFQREAELLASLNHPISRRFTIRGKPR